MENKEENYSSITNELLERTEILKEHIKSSFIPHEKEIQKGIEFFEKELKKINPDNMNNDIVDFIEDTIDKLLINLTESVQRISGRMIQGIKCCYNILETYNKNRNVRRKKH